MPAGTPDDPFVVEAVFEEYAILRDLGLQLVEQRLRRHGGKPFDVLLAVNPENGEEREVWFDISRFFGKL